MTRAVLLLLLALAACEGERERNARTIDTPVATFPSDPRADCPPSRARYYAECADQRAVLAQAIAAAKADGKLVLVKIGAEWCPWCHLLHRHLIGETFLRFDYTYRDGETYRSEEPRARADAEAASALARYMAENYVLVHIAIDDPHGIQPKGGTGWDVIDSHGTSAHFADWVPFTYVVTANGAFVGLFDTRKAERRDEERGYQGYDRTALLAEATRLREETARP